MDALPLRRSVHRTQWAAQFAVASELCKLGYEVAFTMGNHPSVDIMVTSPGGVSFGIDVKGLYKRNFFVLKPKERRADLFYVLAFVPNDAPNRFFILSQEQANQAVAEGQEHSRQLAIAKGKPVEQADQFPCVSWRRAEVFKNCWPTLPA